MKTVSSMRYLISPYITLLLQSMQNDELILANIVHTLAIKMLCCDNLLARHSFCRQQTLHLVLFTNTKKYPKYGNDKIIFNHKLQGENKILYFIWSKCNNQFE